MVRKKRQSKNYTYHLIRALIALIGASILSWAVWKLLDHYLFPETPFISSAIAIFIAVLVLMIDHFHLRELE